jgi:hypothetical protein
VGSREREGGGIDVTAHLSTVISSIRQNQGLLYLFSE